MKVGIFIDVSNLYHGIRKKYQGKLDYQKYLEFIKDFGEIKSAQVHGSQKKKEAEAFIKYLNFCGYSASFRKDGINALVRMTLDIVKDIPNLDLVVLGSNNKHFLPLLETFKEKKFIILACQIPESFKILKHVRCIEIPQSLVKVEEDEIS